MAYGARLESVLGASPRGFESPILRRFSVIDNDVNNKVTVLEAVFETIPTPFSRANRNCSPCHFAV